MIWFIVILCEILLILMGVAIVAISYKLPKVLYPDNITNPPLDNLTDSDHNRTIEIEKEKDYE